MTQILKHFFLFCTADTCRLWWRKCMLWWLWMKSMLWKSIPEMPRDPIIPWTCCANPDGSRRHSVLKWKANILTHEQCVHRLRSPDWIIVSDQITDDCGCLDLWNRSKARRSPVYFSWYTSRANNVMLKTQIQLNGVEWRLEDGLMKYKKNCLMERVEGSLTLGYKYHISTQKVFPFTL